MKHMELKPIAYIQTEFPSKFGVPRQSGLAATPGKIVFEPEYRSADAVRGLEEYSHIWLLWGFSKNESDHPWHATVRPPRLGGNQRVGVWATRSPFRPNPIGLSCVELQQIELTPDLGPVLSVTGADLVDGTPIYDIKPYLPYVDCKPEATGSFSEKKKEYCLKVEIPEHWMSHIPENKKDSLIQVLSQDPRPSYHQDSERVYWMEYAGMGIRFTVEQGCLYVREICPLQEQQEEGK